MSRKVKKNGVMADVSLDKTKKYKYSSTGDLVAFTGTLGDNEIAMSGSKSSLRRTADMERNISILATQMLTTDNGATDKSSSKIKSAAAADATSKANAAQAAAIAASAAALSGGLCITYSAATGEIKVDTAETASSLLVADSNKLGTELPAYYRIDIYDVNGTIVN